MKLRSLCMSPLQLALSLCLAGSALGADQLYVAGPGGQVLRADTETGVFMPLTPVAAGPIIAMVENGSSLFVADSTGAILTFDLESGALLRSSSVPMVPTSLVIFEDNLFIGGAVGGIMSMNTVTGNLSDTRPAPTQINAMVVHKGELYVAGADGAVYTADARGGPFSYFTCFCFTNIQAMTLVKGDLFVGDQFGFVAEVDLGTGFIQNAFGVSIAINKMAAQGGDLLMNAGGGAVKRVDRRIGLEVSEYMAPITISAMLVVKDPVPDRVIQNLPKPVGGLRH